MTLHKLIQKYRQFQQWKYETITIAQVINDLYQVKSIGKPPKEKNEKSTQPQSH